MARWTAIAVLALGVADARAQEPAGAVFGEPWARVLATHTHAVADTAGTRVDYAAIARDPAWAALLRDLAAAAPPADSAPRAERLAFWINAYNALAIDVVARNLPLASIRDAGSLLRPVWKREAGHVGGRAVTLDEIEHEILRPMGEPRIHVAIVCASTSCPSLAREPFDAARLEAQLDAAAARFVADERKGVRVEADRVRLSPIFEWFASDFAAGGGVLAFVRHHAAPDLRAALARLGPDPRTVHFDYDWTLNGWDRRDDDDGIDSSSHRAPASRG
jgi:hypothetical protein